MRELIVEKMSWDDYKIYKGCWRNICRYRKSKKPHKTGVDENKKLANAIVDKYLRIIEKEKKKHFGD